MPTYAYRCPSCDNEFDEFQKMTDPPHARCPRCGESAQRVITGGAGFLLKGGGFYGTDYRSEGYKKAAKAESGVGEAGSAAKESATSEDRKSKGKKPESVAPSAASGEGSSGASSPASVKAAGEGGAGAKQKRPAGEKRREGKPGGGAES